MATERDLSGIPPSSSFRPWLVLAPLIIFLLLASVELERPGLHYDEALEAGVPAVQLLSGQPISALNGAALHVGGWALPLMVQSHIGAIQVYAALPFIFFGGSNAQSLRAMTVLVGVLTIVAVYSFVAQVYGQLAALYASLWLATFASFVFWSRQGVFVTSLAPCFAVCALAIGAYWWRTQRLWAIGLAGLCAGLAVYSKLNALWLVNAMVVWGLLITGRRLLSSLRHWCTHRSRALAIGLAGVLLGVWPLILYNLLTGGATLQIIQTNAGRTYLGVSNADILGNLNIRLAQVADVLRSGNHLWYLGGSFPNQIALASALVALLVLLIGCAYARGRNWRSILLVPFLALLTIVQSCYTISDLWPTHFAIAVPLPAMIFGVGVGQAREWWRQDSRRSRNILRWLVALLPVPVLISQLATSLSYLNVVDSTGGLSFHSTAVYDLARFLENRPEHIVALDWGISAPIEYLSHAQIHVEEMYTYEQTPPPSFGEQLRRRFNRDELYITHAEHEEAFPHRTAFLRAVADAGLRAEPINVSVRSDGWPIFEVWRVRSSQ